MRRASRPTTMEPHWTGDCRVVDDRDIMAALATVKDPQLGRSLVDLGMVRDVHAGEEVGRAMLVLTTAACPLQDAGAALLGPIPLDFHTRQGGDTGMPAALYPETVVGGAFTEIARAVIARRPASRETARP